MVSAAAVGGCLRLASAQGPRGSQGRSAAALTPPRSSSSSSRRACRLQAVGQDAPGSSSLADAAAAAGPGAGLKPELRDAIQQFIDENKVVAFIKGTKQFPMCGFSNTVVQILNSCGVPYVTVNVLEDDMLRSGMKEFSQWPTFPQVYIDGEFFGGADIMIQAYTSGELSETLEAALNS